MHSTKRLLSAAFLGFVLLGCDDGDETEGASDAGTDAAVRSGPGTYELGPFNVEVDQEGHLIVTHDDAPKRKLLTSEVVKSFVQGFRVSDEISEQSGSFVIKEKIAERCDGLKNVAIAFADSLQITAQLGCENGVADAKLTFAKGSDSALSFSLEIDPGKSGVNQVALVSGADADEKFAGFGEQFSFVNLRGHAFPVIVQEGGIGRSGAIATQFNTLSAGSGGSVYSTYAPMPYYLTDQGRALLLDNKEVSFFDLTPKDHVLARVRGLEMRGSILFGETPKDVVEALTEITGRMRSLPDWVHRGAIVGMQGGTARVREVLAQLEAESTPLAAFWLQDWVGKRATAFGSRLWWNWQLNATQYPLWRELVSDLESKQIRMMTYMNPYLVDVAGDPAFSRNLYQEAKEAGFLVKDAMGAPYVHVSGTFEAGIVDLTNPDAVRFLKDVVRDEVMGAGASGYMADFGEAVAFDAKLENGTVDLVHNEYPELWAKLNQEVHEELGTTDDAVYFMRSGFTRSPGLMSLFWTGDQMVTWDEHDGLKSVVTALLSSGLSGISLNHSDIGGYTSFAATVRDKELLLRWMELAAFTAIYRTHEGNQPDANAQFYDDAESLAFFARFARIHAALFDYRKALMKDAAATGMPLTRHLLLDAPEDPRAWEEGSEFLLGPDVLVAPVMDPGRTRVTAYLPKGEWVHLWSSAVYGAGEVEVDAPLGQPGVFYRKGSQAGVALEAVK